MLSFRHGGLKCGSAHRNVLSTPRALLCPTRSTVPYGGDIQAGDLHHPCPAAHPWLLWVCAASAALGWAALPAGRKAEPVLHLLCPAHSSAGGDAPGVPRAPISAGSTPELAGTGAGSVLFTALPQGITHGCWALAAGEDRAGGAAQGQSFSCCLLCPWCAEWTNKAEAGTKWAQSGQLHPGHPDRVNYHTACGTWCLVGLCCPSTAAAAQPSPSPWH